LLYRRADLLLASSDVMEDDLRSLTGANITRLDNPVDVAVLRRIDVFGGRRPGSGRALVFVGRLTPVKAIDELLRAFASAGGPDDRLEILGEGPERMRLDALIDELSLRSRVTLHGARTDHWAFVARADALVLASHHEGMPNAALEALALGTPVLATTDLAVLASLSKETEDGALRLVARKDLVRAIAEIERLPDTELPRRSLLPERFARAAVIDRLTTLMSDLRPQDGRPGQR
jgi:glycosyltransferase involved in cell wall biosynthesis